MKKIITTAALIARINRKLKHDFEALRTARGARMRMAVGEYYIVNLQSNAVLHHDIDPESYGRDFGVLRDWEMVAE